MSMEVGFSGLMWIFLGGRVCEVLKFEKIVVCRNVCIVGLLVKRLLLKRVILIRLGRVVIEG